MTDVSPVLGQVQSLLSSPGSGMKHGGIRGSLTPTHVNWDAGVVFKEVMEEDLVSGCELLTAY